MSNVNLHYKAVKLLIKGFGQLLLIVIPIVAAGFALAWMAAHWSPWVLLAPLLALILGAAYQIAYDHVKEQEERQKVLGK